MAWLAVDKNGSEYIYDSLPRRECFAQKLEYWVIDNNPDDVGCLVELPDNAIEKLIGRKLTWDDEPVEI